MAKPWERNWAAEPADAAPESPAPAVEPWKRNWSAQQEEAAPEPVEAGGFYVPEPDFGIEPQSPGALSALAGGARRTLSSLQTMGNVVAGDDEDVYRLSREAQDIPQTPDQQAFMGEIQKGVEESGDDSIWQGIKNVARATWNEPVGAFHEMVAQLPNSGVVLGGMYAGAKVGGVAGTAVAPGVGTAVGTIVGGITGMFLGNTAIEGGFIAQEQAGEGEYDRDETLRQASIKGGFITGVDVATLGINRYAFSAGSRAASRAMAGGAVNGKAAQATAETVTKILQRNGIDAADKAATASALGSNRALVREIREEGAKAYWKALPKSQKAALTTAGIGLESFGEGFGEYGGSTLAGLDASFTEAVLEGMMSLPQSAAEVGISRVLARPGSAVAAPPGAHVPRDQGGPGSPPDGPGDLPPEDAPLDAEQILGAVEEEPTAPPETPAAPLTTEPGESPVSASGPVDLARPVEESAPQDILSAEPEPSPAPAPTTPAAPVKQTRQQRLKQDRTIQADQDDLLAAIAKAGGLNREEAEAQGIDPAEFNRRGYKIARVFTKKGMNFDAMAEALSQHGYPVLDEAGNYNPNTLLDALSNALAGNRVFTPQGYENWIAKQQADQEQAQADVPAAPAPDGFGEFLNDPQDMDDLAAVFDENDAYTDSVASLAELKLRGEAALGEDEVEAILERVAAQTEGQPGEAFAQALEDAIQEAIDARTSERDAAGEPDGGRLQGAAPPAPAAGPAIIQPGPGLDAGIQPGGPAAPVPFSLERPVAPPPAAPAPPPAQDMFGPAPVAEQAMFDAKNAVEQALSGEDVPADAGPGDLFSGKAKQVDIADAQEPDTQGSDRRRKKKPGLKEDKRTGQDRRKDPAARKRVAEMDEKEMRQALLVDDLTGLGNRRAYDESDKMPIQVSIDLDGLKFINDTYGHSAGDQLLAEFGAEVLEVTGDGYHISGDEFIIQAINETAARRIMAEVEQRAAEAEVHVTKPDGEKVTIEGIGFSYGYGQDIETADAKLRDHKAERERQGLRGKRGEPAPGGATEGTAEGQQDNQDQPAVDAAAHEAATSPENNRPEPTDAQKEAGNYKKGHITIQGLDISIENPAGSRRRPEWPALTAHYGYIKGTVGKDKDHIDVFLGENAEQAGTLFVIDQIDPKTGKFDEHKVIIGPYSQEEAVSLYQSNYEKGWQGAGAITHMDIAEFKEWLQGDTTKPVKLKETPAKKAVKKKHPGTKAKPTPSKNTIFTDDAAEKARAILKAKLGQMNSGIDPEIMQAGITLAGHHIEKGARTFAAYAKAMVDDLGDLVKPYLKSWYMGVKYDPRAVDLAGMDDAATVDKADLDTILAANEDPVIEPQTSPEAGGMALAKAVEGWLERDVLTIDWRTFFKEADKAYGGTQADGAYSPKQAYDAMELGLNQYIAKHPELFSPNADIEKARKIIEHLESLAHTLPTQTRRSQEQQDLQQFSTPPMHAYVAAWVARISGQDTVVEPSAGTGNLVAQALNAGARAVYANELSEGRADLLESMGAERVTRENASHLNSVLPAEIKPTVVLMNPPFSADANIPGKKNTGVGAKHVEEALKRLQPDGRLVAILGRGMALDKPAFKAWWKGIKGKYNVRANIGISGQEYTKFGTSFDNVMVVIDKTGPTIRQPVTGNVEKVQDLLDLLQEIRDDRAAAAEQPSAESGRAPGARRPGTQAGSRVPVQPAADAGRPESGDLFAPSAEPKRPDRDGGRAPVGKTGQRDAVPAGDGPARGGNRPRGATGPGAGGTVAGAPAGTADQGSRDVAAVSKAKKDKAGKLTDSTFEHYQPNLRIEGAQPHPTKLAESAAMASVEMPDIDYQPSIPAKIITSGKLSEVQLEAISYAGAAHQQKLESGARRGFYIGDGTGVGKGAQVAGIILDNWNQGRRKAVWVSENVKLAADAERDLNWIGMDAKKVLVKHPDIKAGQPIKSSEGVMFTTYSTLASAIKETKDADGTITKQATRRIDQLVEWLGEDFDGVIAFDEAHNMGNAVDQKGTRGIKKASAKALSGIELQQRLPNARVVYVSATAATEVSNLAYADRLGLWGPGTAFPDKSTFISEISAGGVAAMEVVAKDMKAMGLYVARSLSFEDVTYDMLEQELTEPQRDIYNTLATAWQGVLQNVNAALIDNNSDRNGGAKSAAYSAFWGSHQRFFNQVMTAMQAPAIIRDVEQQLDGGNSAVLQLVNTNEAVQERRMAQAAAADIPLEEVDITPRDILMQYVSRSFPTTLYEEYTDDEGNARTRQVVDSEGNPVQNPDSLRRRDELMEKLASIDVPEGILEQLFNHFGSDAIAEITGRSRRLVRQKDGRVVEERLGVAKSNTDARAFMDGKKRILVFSDAGGTGRSYHADLRAKNQQKRIHYLVQPGWRADKAVQGFGRTHRTNQAQAPQYKLVTTNLKAQRRFLSSIARRLDQLGALSKGQRDTANQGMFKSDMNLENQYADMALQTLVEDLYKNQAPGLSLNVLEDQMGISVRDGEGNLKQDINLSVPKFLNRLLSLNIEEMDQVFDAFFERLKANIEYAKQTGTFDVGMETIGAESVEKVEETDIQGQEGGRGTTKYVKLALTDPVRFTQFDDLPLDAKGLVFARNKRSGKLYALVPAMSATDTKTGAKVERLRRIGVASAEHIEKADVTDKYEIVNESDHRIRAAWDEEISNSPPNHTREVHMISGALLPVWDRLPTSASTKILRAQTDSGERVIGRSIPARSVPETLKRLGVAVKIPDLTPRQFIDNVLNRGDEIELANGWKLTSKMVSGQKRIEVTGYDYADQKALKDYGGFVEIIAYKGRMFLPVDKAPEILASIIKSKPIVEVTPGGGEARFSRTGPASAGFSVSGVEQAISRAVLGWNQEVAPQVTVVQSVNDLPEAAREGIDLGQAPAGVALPGQVYLIADHIRSDQHARTVLTHEGIGHYAVDQIMESQDWGAMKRQLHWMKQAGNKRILELLNEVHRHYSADIAADPDVELAELIAIAAERRVSEGLAGKLLRKMRELLRAFFKRLGMNQVLADADIDTMITRAARFMRTGKNGRGGAGGGSGMFARTAPTFYSQMQRVLTDKLPGKGSAAQIKKMIEAYAKKGEFKAEELEWSGLSEWLAGDPGRKVTKAEVLEFLRANEIQVQEVMKGEDLTHDRLGWMNRGNIYVPSSEFGTRFGRIEELNNGKFLYLTPGGTRELHDTLQAAKDHLLAVANYRGVDNTKFEKYQLAGGENYRELLLTLPEVKTSKPYEQWLKENWTGVDNDHSRDLYAIQQEPDKNFKSSHFDEPNVLAHVRFNERTDADGKRVLFLEEVQSDWHQQGRKEGYKGEFPKNVLDAAVAGGMVESQARADILHLMEEPLSTKGRSTEEQWSRLTRATENSGIDLNDVFHDRRSSAAPNAPFKTTWPLLTMKRMIRYAAENGFDRIAWTTGEQQADRYKLSRHISKVEVAKDFRDGDYHLAVWDKDDRQIVPESTYGFSVLNANKLAEYIGKELADRAINDLDNGREAKYSGLDLNVGGDGMKGFYDNILPNEVNKYVKKWGGKVEQSSVSAPVPGFAEFTKDRTVDAHALDVTPSMRDAALQGQPLFSRRQPDDDVQQAQAKMNSELNAGQPLDKVFRAVFKILHVDTATKAIYEKGVHYLTEAKLPTDKETGPFSWMNGVMEHARAGLIDRYGLPESYVHRDFQREADKRNIELKTLDFLQAIQDRGVTDPTEAAVLQAVLTGEQVPEGKWAELAAPIREAIDELGQEAMELGLITREAYERNKGSYLHRVYLKHEGRQNALGKWVANVSATRRKRIRGDELKGRGMTLGVGMDNLLALTPANWWGRKEKAGQADKALHQAEFIVFDRLAHTGEGTETIDGMDQKQRGKLKERIYWPADVPVPAKYEAWENRGRWQVRDVKGGKAMLWRDFTKQERMDMGEMLDARYTITKTFMLMAHDLSTGRFLKDIADNPEWSRKEEPENWSDPKGAMSTYANVEWVRVPTDMVGKTSVAKWGALAGRFVRAEIWRDLNELDRMQMPGFWRTMMTQWKLNKTARNPVVHLNNVMSNLLFMDMADIRWRDLKRALASYIEKDEHYRDAMQNGAFGASYVEHEIRRDILDPILQELMQQDKALQTGAVEGYLKGNEWTAKMAVLGRMADQVGQKAVELDKKMTDIYQFEDEIFRLATYLRRVARGDDKETAARIARDQFLNYDIRAPWVNAARRTFLPFISYTYRAVPVIAKSLAERPWKIAKYATVAYAMNALAYALAPGDDDEDKERRSMRDEVQGHTWLGTPRMIRMPYLDEWGNPVFLDIRRWIPAGDVFDTNQGQMPLPAWMQFGGPLMLAGEFALNKQAFTGEEIVNDLTDTAGDKAKKYAGWAWRSWMPSAPWIPGSWYWNKIGRSITGGRDMLGREYDLPTAAASSVGIKLQAHDVDLGLQFKARDIQRVSRALQSEMRMLENDRRRRMIREDEYAKQRASIQRKMENLQERAAETFQD